MNINNDYPVLTFTRHEAFIIERTLSAIPPEMLAVSSLGMLMADAVAADHTKLGARGCWPAYRRLVIQLPLLSAHEAEALYEAVHKSKSVRRLQRTRKIKTALPLFLQSFRLNNREHLKFDVPLPAAV